MELDHDGLFNLEAEQAILGCLLFENTVLNAVQDLDARHFYEPLHAQIWALGKAMIGRRALFEVIAVYERLRDDVRLEEVGGIRYLADLVDRAPPAANAVTYAGIVHDLGLRRDLIALGHGIAASARSRQAPAFAHVGEAERQISELAHGSAPSDANLVDARSAAEETMDEFEEEAAHGRPKGAMTGLRCIDRRLRGLRPGHLIIIGGRPGMGKTALARVAADGCAGRNPKDTVVFFALEMARRELIERALAALSHEDGSDISIAYQDMSGDKLDPMQRSRLRDLLWKVPKNLIIDDTSSLSVDYVERRIWALKRKGNLVAAFIDYLQIMERPAAAGRNDAAVISEMTARLKRLARDTGIAIVLLSQINRGVESREDKRPQLSDLRESGSIEQDANSVLFPFREFYYVERAEPKAGTEHDAWETQCEMLRRRMDVLCAKNRGGAIGLDRQEYFAEFDRIVDAREERDSK